MRKRYKKGIEFAENIFKNPSKEWKQYIRQLKRIAKFRGRPPKRSKS